MSSGIPALIKNNVTAVLLSKPEGIPMPEFLSDYRNLHHEPLKFRDFGYTTLQNFIKSIPDVARMAATEDYEILILGVGEPDSYKPAIPFKAQNCFQKHTKSTNVEKLSLATGIPSLQTNPSKDYFLEPDYKGLYSVCLPSDLCPTRIPEALKAIFSQAGAVVETHFTEKWVFVRYAHKEEALLAKEMFSDIHVCIANNNNKKNKHRKDKSLKTENYNENMHGSDSDKMSDCCASVESSESQMSNRGSGKKLQPHLSNDRDNRNTVSTMIEKTFGRCHKDEKLNHGYHSEHETSNRICSSDYQDSKLTKRRNSPHATLERIDSSSGVTELFVDNIDCKDDFKEKLRPLHSFVTKLAMDKEKKNDFVKVSTKEDTRQTTENLHNKWQKAQIYFDKCPESNHSDFTSDEKHSDTPFRIRSEKMSKETLETDCTLMPPLIHVSELDGDEENYRIDCSIFVANFPINSLESTLRNAFVKYHVLDICMVNNGNGPGCTKAFLYLVTAYDVIQAVIEMNGSCIFGEPLKVDVPYTNTILRVVVDKERQKQRAINLSNDYTKLQNSY